MTIRRFIGIDPGKSGGISAVEGDDLIYSRPIPLVSGGGEHRDEYDVPGIARELRTLVEAQDREAYLVIEQLHPMPNKIKRKDGSVAESNPMTQFGLGLCYGGFTWAFQFLGWGYTPVHSKTWQKMMLRGLPTGNNKINNQSSCIAAGRLWPAADFRETPRCRTPHSGMSASALIAEWFKRYIESFPA